MEDLKVFPCWCQRVLPLVYDDSLSYMEILCKVVKYINDLIAQDRVFADDIEDLKADMATVQNWINNFDTSYAEKVLADAIATMIFVEISNAGYIIYYIPENWHDIVFNTTGLDINIAGEEYGKLVLSY